MIILGKVSFFDKMTTKTLKKVNSYFNLIKIPQGIFYLLALQSECESYIHIRSRSHLKTFLHTFTNIREFEWECEINVP
jgi:hypothetical protein